MISIIDYGVGNLFSIKNAIKKLGYDSLITDDESTILSSTHVILPGVGAFGEAITKLKEKNLDKTIYKLKEKNIKVLGICVGMQMLFIKDFEFGEYDGLKIVDGSILKFDGNFKIPHVGFNTVEHNDDPLFKGIKQDEFFYFVHSYMAPSSKDEIAKTNYFVDFVSAVRKDNIYGVQFHPEKSGEAGLKLLDNFLKL